MARPEAPRASPAKNWYGTRVRNADEASARWVRTGYWTPDTEQAFQDWLARLDLSNPWPIVSEYCERGLGVSFKRHDEGQYVCTLSDGARRELGKPCLVSGWSDDLTEALAVAMYKDAVILDRDWDTGDSIPEQKRYRR